jgi:RND family efflux transporter MFP subunit
MPEPMPPDFESGPAERSEATPFDHGLWREFVEAKDVEQFCRSWLGLQAQQIGGVTGGAVVFDTPDVDAPALGGVWPRGFSSDKLRNVIGRAAQERKGIVIRAASPEAAAEASEEPAFHVAYPIWIGKAVQGVAALEISSRAQTQLQLGMRQLQWGAAWLQNWLLRQATRPARAGKRMTTVLEIVGLTLEEPRFKSAATAVATELAARFKCDRVSIGFLTRGQVKVRALSHSAQFAKRMNLIRSIGLAMAEAVDQQSTLQYPEVPDGEDRVVKAHEQLARNHGDAVICTVPFVDHEGHAFGAVTFERATSEPFDEDTLELTESVAALIGPILGDKQKNDRLLIVKAWDSLLTQGKRLVGPRYALRKLIALAAVTLALFFAFANGQYRVGGKTTLEGKVRRVIAAPFPGFVHEAPVRGGDIVKKGQAICSLDVRDLRLEFSRWSSERGQYAMEHRKAMAGGDRALMNVLNKKMLQAEAQIALLDEQIARAKIVAPFDGLVVNGDLSQSLGAPVEAGQVLFEIAPLDSYRVKVQVEERSIGQVQVGQQGELILTSMPNERHSFTVNVITPVAQAEEGANFFIVEGTLDGAAERLRPGMEGFGKIQIEERKLIWIWTHELLDWARMKAWTWLP